MAGDSGAIRRWWPPHPDERDWLISDEAMEELKRQAPDGCVLCELEHFDGEDWE